MKQAIIGAAAGLATAGILLAFGPLPLNLSSESTGSETISATLTDEAAKGHHDLTAFIYDNGEVTFGGLGADEHTEVEIGSLTKTFNAELVRQLVEEKQLTVETTVGELYEVNDTPIADVTIGELLNHTAGLDTIESITTVELLTARVRDGGNPYRRDTPQQILDSAKDATLKGRGEYNYSNYSQALLGQLLALHTGSSYEAMLRTRIFEPAGMSETYLAAPGTVDDAPRGRRTDGRAAKPWDMDGWAPAGAIRSTATDMAKYVAWVADHGRPDDGWLEREIDGTEYPYHNGGTGGFSTVIVWDPADPKRAAFVAGNTPLGVEVIGAALLRTPGTGKENKP
ncbi:serine hydrolase domain-containing protein [Corynebacterium mayonis]|uniref:serine hydrolase domain-containing protein n=1 Tax=Corynebacterium mayonis TaxID=3062461 RepID=UPI0031408D81